ncbi:MAG: aldo/keto reductase [Campylobacteraceae bacterium]|jgi:aryl-alcohol dehydrogenase-like predicted oxidoreductase|nr:aldo/keto reductase [Campylobacteraceae bacterium]
MYATTEATYDFAKKFSHYKDFYLKHNDLYFSKLGFGTFKKEPYKEENYTFDYKDALKSAIRGGINVIDTAINYRYQQSEREVGELLGELFASGEVEREELIVCSKGGFIPLDFPFPKNPYEWIEDNIIKKDYARADDIELDQHCMTPKFLKASLEKSLENLQIRCLDIYFLHNPETQLQKLGTKRFLKKIEEIFALFEALVAEGKMRSYGVAVWNAFTYDENNSEHINIESLCDIALKVGGEHHHFKYIQLPFNIAKTEGYRVKNQKMKDGCYYTLLDAARKLTLGVIGSSSLLAMNLFKSSFKPEVGYLLDKDMRLASDIELALQFVRSTKGIITSLFSSKASEHVRSNLNIANINAAPASRYDLLYRLSK